MTKIAWSRVASDAIAAFVLHEQASAGHGSANALQQAIMVRVRLLRGFPELGKLIPELPDGDIRELPVGAYRVLYRATDDAVFILNVVQAHTSVSLAAHNGRSEGSEP